MAQVSKQYLDKKTQQRTYKIFVAFFKDLSKRKSVGNVLSEFFTPTERVYMTKRLMIAYFLIKGIDHDTIVEVLKVSRSTTYAVSQRMKKENSVLRHELERFFSKEVVKGSMKQLLGDLLPKDPRFIQAKLHQLEHDN